MELLVSNLTTERLNMYSVPGDRPVRRQSVSLPCLLLSMNLRNSKQNSSDSPPCHMEHLKVSSLTRERLNKGPSKVFLGSFRVWFPENILGSLKVLLPENILGSLKVRFRDLV